MIRRGAAPVRALPGPVRIPQGRAGVPGQQQLQEAFVAHLVDHWRHGIVIHAATQARFLVLPRAESLLGFQQQSLTG